MLYRSKFVAAERAKLEKELEKIESFIKTKESKLNSDFINKAPAAVVEKERQSLDDLRNQRQSAAEALEQLRKSQ